MDGKNTYFVTGAFGFLGQFIVRALCEHDPCAEIRAQVRTKRKTYVPVESYEQVKTFKSDLSDPSSYSEQLESVTTIVHNAALVSFKESDRDAIYQANFVNTKKLVELAVQKKVKNFIFISSISAVALRPPQISDETMLPDLESKKNDPYGYTKLLAELELKKHAHQIRVIILNPSVIIGPGSQRVSGMMRWLRFAPFVPMLPTINSFVDVRDVSQAVVLAETAGRSGERYILTEHNISMLDLSRFVVKLLNKNVPVFALPGSAISFLDWVVDFLKKIKKDLGIRKISHLNIDKAYSNQKARLELGWKSSYTLEQTLLDMLSVIEK